jgi:hypothetical protein
VSAVW